MQFVRRNRESELTSRDPLALSGTITPVDCVTASVHADGVVLLHRGDGRVYTANRTGARIWSALERQRHFGAIIEDLTQSEARPTSSSRAIIHEQTVAFVLELARHRLVTLKKFTR